MGKILREILKRLKSGTNRFFASYGAWEALGGCKILHEVWKQFADIFKFSGCVVFSGFPLHLLVPTMAGAVVEGTSRTKRSELPSSTPWSRHSVYNTKSDPPQTHLGTAIVFTREN